MAVQDSTKLPVDSAPFPPPSVAPISTTPSVDTPTDSEILLMILQELQYHGKLLASIAQFSGKEDLNTADDDDDIRDADDDNI